MYGCEVWGFHEGNEVEKVHSTFCKYILQVSPNTCNVAVLGELGRHTLRTMRLIRIVKYWLKLLRCDNSRFIKQCYNYQFEMAEKNYNCWAKKVKDLLFSFGFGFVWESQNVGNESVFLSMFKQRCFDISSQKWSMEIETYSKLDSYRLFKQDLFLEDYLNVININIFRKTMSKFRVSNHNLRIESGRAENLTRERRICQMCHLNQVETELHFCLICPLYNDLRITILSPFFLGIPFHI